MEIFKANPSLSAALCPPLSMAIGSRVPNSCWEQVTLAQGLGDTYHPIRQRKLEVTRHLLSPEQLGQARGLYAAYLFYLGDPPFTSL